MKIYGPGRLLAVIAVCVVAVSLSGCLRDLSRKFVRKRQKPDITPYYRVEEYPDKPYCEKYHAHYTYWHNWHMELDRKALTHKRQVESANEALRHLAGMRDCLVEAKALELQVQVEDMEEISARIRSGQDTIYDARLRRMLDKVERVVINNFGENRVRDHLKPDGV